MTEREAGGLSWAETVAMRNELRLERERADRAETEILRIGAALHQVTEQHAKLVDELATQYRDAERVGWLPPKDVKKLHEVIDALRADNERLRKVNAQVTYRDDLPEGST